MFVEFDDCLQRHLNRLSPALRLQDFPGISYKPLVQPQRYQWLCHITSLLRVYTTYHYCNTSHQVVALSTLDVPVLDRADDATLVQSSEHDLDLASRYPDR